MLAQAAGLAGQAAPSSTPSSAINATSTTSATHLTDTTSRFSDTHAGATSRTTASVPTGTGLSLPTDTAATFPLTGPTSTGTAPAKTALPNTVDLSTGSTSSLPTPSGTDAKAIAVAAANTAVLPSTSNNASATPAGPSLTIGAPSDAAIINTLPGTVLSEAATSANASNQLSAQVGTPDWNQALSQRVVWMVHGGEQSATLSLNPPDLGPLQVVLNVSNSQANATFITAQPEVKQALEAAMPRLEAMLAGAGIQLGQANVQSGNSGQRQPSQSSPGQSGLSQINNLRSSNGQPNSSLLPLNTEKPYSGQGLVNTFV
jgi:flagellar hook-length control protein FliK